MCTFCRNKKIIREIDFHRFSILFTFGLPKFNFMNNFSSGCKMSHIFFCICSAPSSWDNLHLNSFIISVYFDTTSDCHDLNFSFLQNAQGTAKESNRRFSVKVLIPFILPSSTCLDSIVGIRSNSSQMSTFNF